LTPPNNPHWLAGKREHGARTLTQSAGTGSLSTSPSTATLDTRLTWSAHINEVGKKVAQRLGVLGPLLNRSGLSIRNSVLLYRQFIHLMMDYACPVWRSAARSRVWKLHVLQSKCLRIATSAPWYIDNRQIHNDLVIPSFADHIRALTESFDSKLSDAGNP